MVSNSVNAAIFNVSGVENLEWLDLTATAGMTRDQVEAQLGVNGTFDGWRYAARSEVETLNDGLWGGTTEGFSADNLAGSQTLIDAFGTSTYFDQFNNGGYRSDGITFWFTFYGEQNECLSTTTLTSSCIATIALRNDQFGGTANGGYFSDEMGLSTGLDDINLTYTRNSDQLFSVETQANASYLVREVSAVPIPAVIWQWLNCFSGFSQT